ncbi:MAG: hypothetical protein ACR2HD_02380 [Solirubrobacteraceae bacterium]|nr:MAG: hypothetical protein DLM63_02590 [Solirubrobacterales bacterium]
MSNTTIVYLIAACSGVFSLAAWVGLVLMPAWTSYTRAWQRLVATLLSLYVLAAMAGIGALAGYGIFTAWRSWSG